MRFYIYMCKRFPLIHRLYSDHLYSKQHYVTKFGRSKVFSVYTLFLPLLERVDMPFIIKRQASPFHHRYSIIYGSKILILIRQTSAGSNHYACGTNQGHKSPIRQIVKVCLAFGKCHAPVT